MQIESILNPAPLTPTRRRTSKTTRASTYHEISSSYSPEPTSNKKSSSKKAPKDAPKWDEGPTVGKVRFRPYNISTTELARLRTEFKFYAGPKGNVEVYPEHIPYSSDKKNFLAKTGREAFEVFHYTFKHREGSEPEKDWVVMWDYNIGLVRITPFFKCMPGHRKTDPKNAILASPGLMDLCHSITGGAILAQGYWLPYHAAFALASTFTYSIRHALVPLFGPSFPSACLHPNDPLFKRWSIPASIVTTCTHQMRSWTRTPAKKGIATSMTASTLATIATGEMRTVRKKSHLRPRDVGVYDPSDLDSEGEDEALNVDDRSTSASTMIRNDLSDSDYAATQISDPETEVSKSSWTAANTPVYPTPPRYPPPFVFTTSARGRERTDSECISPCNTASTMISATKRKRPDLDNRNSHDIIRDTAGEAINLPNFNLSGNAVAHGNAHGVEWKRGEAGTSRNPAMSPHLRHRDNDYNNDHSNNEDEEEEDESGEGNHDDDNDGTYHEAKKRRINRKTGRFYADEVGAAQALVKMSEGCWGAALR